MSGAERGIAEPRLDRDRLDELDERACLRGLLRRGARRRRLGRGTGPRPSLRRHRARGESRDQRGRREGAKATECFGGT